MYSLIIKNLSHSYNSRVVFSSLNLSINTNSLSIIGPNGCGKTTLLKIISGLLKPTIGSLSLSKDNIEYYSSKRNIGYCGPNTNLYPELTLYENLELIIGFLGQKKGSSYIKLIIELVELEKECNRQLSKLSTGQIQRAKIAASIIHKPQFLMLDEPSSNLDDRGKNILKTITQEHINNHRMLIIATNDVEDTILTQNIFNLGDFIK